MQAQQQFEFNKPYDANDGAGKSSGTASDAIRPNMADPEFNAMHKSASKNSNANGGNNLELFCGMDPPKDAPKEEEFKTQTPEQKAKARLKVAEATAKFLSQGNKVNLDEDGKALVAAAIEHQLKAGGVKAADSMCDDISTGLPNGIKLESAKSADFEKNVKDVYEKAKLPVPEYIRWVQMKDKSGTVIGEFGVTIDKLPK